MEEPFVSLIQMFGHEILCRQLVLLFKLTYHVIILACLYDLDCLESLRKCACDWLTCFMWLCRLAVFPGLFFFLETRIDKHLTKAVGLTIVYESHCAALHGKTHILWLDL